MKRKMYLIAATMFVVGSMMIGCSSPSEKVEDAQEKERAPSSRDSLLTNQIKTYEHKPFIS